jgi:hypothetical protein
MTYVLPCAWMGTFGLGLAHARAAPQLGETVLELAPDYLAGPVGRDGLLQRLEAPAPVRTFNCGIEGVPVEEAQELRLSQ